MGRSGGGRRVGWGKWECEVKVGDKRKFCLRLLGRGNGWRMEGLKGEDGDARESRNCFDGNRS